MNTVLRDKNFNIRAGIILVLQILIDNLLMFKKNPLELVICYIVEISRTECVVEDSTHSIAHYTTNSRDF